MAVATTSAPNPVSTPYDEMVVPALRKRLEAESQMLSHRLSGHGHSAFADPQRSIDDLSPRAPTSAPPPAAGAGSGSNRARVASPELYAKPSSIPRPSLQMSASYAQSTRDLLAGSGSSPSSYSNANANGGKEGNTGSVGRGSKSERIPQAAVMRANTNYSYNYGPNGSTSPRDDQPPPQPQPQAQPPTARQPRTRTRSQSTPLAYHELLATSPDTPDTPTPIPIPSVLPTPASSRSTSPQTGVGGPVSPNNLAFNLTHLNTGTSALSSRPSGIPVPRSVSAARGPAGPGAGAAGTGGSKTPRSRSRNATSPASASGAAHGPGHAYAEDDLLLNAHLTPSQMRYPPSPEPSPELQYNLNYNYNGAGGGGAGNPVSLRSIPAPFPLQGSVTGGGGASDSEANRSSFERDMRASRAQKQPRGARADRTELELNYRGDTTRNGGRGEVYKEQTEEQLEIATFGHDLSAERKALNAASPRQRGEYLAVGGDKRDRRGGAKAGKGRSAPSPQAQAHAWGDPTPPPHAGYADGLELEEDSVMQERPLTWMVDGDPEGEGGASVTDLILERMGREVGRESLLGMGGYEERGYGREEEMEEEGLPYEREGDVDMMTIGNGNGIGASRPVPGPVPMKFEPRAPPPKASILSKSAPIGRAMQQPEFSSGSGSGSGSGMGSGSGSGNGVNTRPGAQANASGPASTTAHARQRVASKPSAPPPSTRQRVASKPSKVSGPASSGKANGQPRSKSQPANLNLNLHKHQQRDSTGSMSLVDAIPDVPSRRMERGRNWDEVVLPTVARKMGLDTEAGDAEEGQGEFGQREEIFPPAPGTFGYDASKYRSPSSYDVSSPPEAHLATAAAGPRATSNTTLPPGPGDIPPRQSSPAPFSSYTVLPPPPASQSSAHLPAPPDWVGPGAGSERPQPTLQKSSTAIERGKDMRRNKPPKIRITSPDRGLESARTMDIDDGKHDSGCKCVIM